MGYASAPGGVNSPSARTMIAVVGATGTGKSNFSLSIANELAAAGQRAEIVNADAMQLYRGMDIGTAKLSLGERQGIPHHLLDVLDVTEEANVAWYQNEARRIIDDIFSRGGTPILVGGSGLYVSSVLFNYDFPTRDSELRRRLEQEALRDGPLALFERLSTLDPEAAHRIGPHNIRRVIRALEVAELTGTPVSGTRADESTLWRPSVAVGLSVPRDELVGRLDTRVRHMWDSGLVDEVSDLVSHGLSEGVTASRAIGYAQVLSYLAGDLSRDEAIAHTQQLTRRYARRQVSWFKRYSVVHWCAADDPRIVGETLGRL